MVGRKNREIGLGRADAAAAYHKLIVGVRDEGVLNDNFVRVSEQREPVAIGLELKALDVVEENVVPAKRNGNKSVVYSTPLKIEATHDAMLTSETANFHSPQSGRLLRRRCSSFEG